MVQTTRSKNRLYKIVLQADTIHCLQASSSNESSRWHACLGHVNTETMKTMVNKQLVTGIPQIVVDKETCVSCLRGKQTRQPFPQSTSYRASHPLELVHGDLCCPITPSTPGCKRYVFVLIDDYSRYMWTVILEEKSEALDKFKRFKTLAEQETKTAVKTFRTDRGGEFISRDFDHYCNKHGIKRHLTAPYSPQQNGVVERRNRTLLEMTRSILKHMSVPNYLWGEAVKHATYLINRSGQDHCLERRHTKLYERRNRMFIISGYLAVFVTQGLKVQEERSLMIGLEPWYIWELSLELKLTVCWIR